MGEPDDFEDEYDSDEDEDEYYCDECGAGPSDHHEWDCAYWEDELD